MQKSVEDTLRNWQSTLGIRDWDIRVEVVRGAWRKSGDIKIDACNKLAVLLVSENIAPEFLDEVVLHELLHLKLHGLDRMTEDLLESLYGDDEKDPRRRFAHAQFMDTLERTVQDLTRAMLGLAGVREFMVTPSLRRAVEEETAPE